MPLLRLPHQGGAQDAPLDAYAIAMVQEIDLLAGAMRAKRVEHIHWGGGTPSQIGAAAPVVLTQRMRNHFDLSGVREHAIELVPRFVDAELADTLAAMGSIASVSACRTSIRVCRWPLAGSSRQRRWKSPSA